MALLPTVADAFERLGRGLQRFRHTRAEEVLRVGCVWSLLVRGLMPRLPAFERDHPWIDTHVLTGRYWLARLQSRRDSAAMQAFAAWLQQQCRA